MLAEFTLTIVEQILAVILQQHAFIDIGDIAHDLCHPFLMRIQSDSCDENLTCAQMEEEKNIVGDQAETEPHFRGKEIGGHQYMHVASDELTPGRFLPSLGNRW